MTTKLSHAHPSDRPSDHLDEPAARTPGNTRQAGKARDESISAQAAHPRPRSRRNIGLGRSQLSVLRDGLSTRDVAILRSLSAHRYLSTIQLERWHFVGHATPLSAARRARAVLARLRSVGLLDTLDRRIGGMSQGSSSYLWYLTPAGHRLLTPGAGGKRPFEPSARFLSHRLGVAETHLRLIEASRRGSVDLAEVSTEPECWRSYLSGYGSPQTLKPDLFLIASTPSGEYEHLWFVEWDEGTESIPVIERKATVYDQYRQTGKEQERSGSFPRVLWIVPSESRRDRIRQALGKSALASARLHEIITPSELLETIVRE